MLSALLFAFALAPGADPTASPEPSPSPSTAPAEARLPRPADPWSLLRDTPGVVIDRVGVGGSETGQQSLVVTNGDPGTGVTFTLDGVDVTDPAALGATSLYPDMDALSRVEVQTVPLDVRVRTPGVHLALSTREPTLRRMGAAHARGGGFFQGDNLPSSLAGRPFFRNRTDAVWELGCELGGNVKGDRLWLWGAASRNALRQDTFTEHEERLRTTSFMARARLRMGEGHLSLLAVRGEKRHDDRDPTFTAAPEARLRQSGPVTVIALEDAHSVHGLRLTTRLSLLDAAFRIEPQGGHQDAYEDLRGIFQRSYSFFETSRPRVQALTEVTGERAAFGFRHRLLGGLGYRRSTVETRSGWPAGGVLALERQDVFFRAFHLTGFALPTREQNARSRQEGLETYLQDELHRGRLGLTFGLRLDALSGRNLSSSVPASPVFPDLLPAASYRGRGENVRWIDLLPRIALAWDATGHGTTISRLSYAAYGAGLGSGEVTTDNPLAQGASFTYYWIDRNGDHTVQPGELDLSRGRPGVSGIDPDDPTAVGSPNLVDANLRSPRTRELAGSAEHTFGPRLSARFSGSWRRLTDALWRPLRNLTLGDYVIRGAAQGRLFEDGYSVGYYAPASASRIVKGNGRLLTNREGYHQDAVATTLQLKGRLGASLQWSAWGSLLSWRERFSDRELAVQDPTATESGPLIDNGMVAARGSGLGRSDVFVNARWTAGATLRARLPGSFRSAAIVHARDGFPIPYYKVASTGDPSAGSKNVLVSPALDRYRLPALALVDARLEHDLGWHNRRVTVALEAFNLLDAATTLQVARDVELPAFSRPREILRPRLLRLALDYRF